MKSRLSNFFSNESIFGQIMTRIFILFGANIMFVMFSLPVVTAGPAYVAMYYVCLKTLRRDDTLNPFVEFFRGFRDNIRQSILYWLVFLVICLILILDINFCINQGGMLSFFRFPLYLITAVLLLISFHLFPVMASFDDNLRGLVRDSFYFIGRNPLRALFILFLNIGPLILTYYDIKRIPLYAFLWVTILFSGIAMVVSRTLLKDFEKYLEPIDSCEDL